MPDFILNRTATLMGKGHCIVLRKGEPTYVPAELAREAIAMGAEPVEGDKDQFLEQDAPPAEVMTDADREALLNAAFDQIISRNDSGDFGGDGKPTVAAVMKIVDFTITKKALMVAYQAYRESKAG